ncbi:MAG: DUF11 domain-containing protein, partial [Bacilli bacterium]
DPTPAGTTYIGNLNVNTPYTGTNPATGITLTSVPPKSTATISWQVQVNPNTSTSQVNNIATVLVPNKPIRNTNIATTIINNADLTSNGNFIKTVDKTTAVPGDILTYTITLHNTGNVAANNVVVTDVIPTGTSYVLGSTTSTLPFSGDPTSTITLNAPIAAGSTATITFKVKVGNTVPTINPIPNKASVDYAYTVDPSKPNGVVKNGTSNTVTTNIIKASLSTTKTADKDISYIGEEITYNIVLKNTGNVALDNLVITDVIPNGTSYIAGSLVVSVPYVGNPSGGITLTNPLLPGESVNVSFKVKVI